MAISKELLDILACPKCKGDIYLNDTQDGLICDACKLLYEIKGGEKFIECEGCGRILVYIPDEEN